jgi:glycosyltransferase involved in cell wall biosynthesis
MKIAQIAPLIESVPPRFYGGTERIVSYLAEEFVRLGHDVTLFASGDSVTSARLVSCTRTALRLDRNVRDPIPYYMLMLDRVRKCADEFDILHFHIDQFHFPLFRPLASRTLTTLHGRQDLPDLQPLYVGFNEMPRWSRFPTVSGRPYPMPMWSPPSTMGCPLICTRRHSIQGAVIWLSLGAFHRKRALIARSR